MTGVRNPSRPFSVRSAAAVPARTAGFVVRSSVCTACAGAGTWPHESGDVRVLRLHGNVYPCTDARRPARHRAKSTIAAARHMSGRQPHESRQRCAIRSITRAMARLMPSTAHNLHVHCQRPARQDACGRYAPSVMKHPANYSQNCRPSLRCSNAASSSSNTHIRCLRRARPAS